MSFVCMRMKSRFHCTLPRFETKAWSFGNVPLTGTWLIYRKIPKIGPGAYIFQTPFLRGLFLEGLVFRGAYLRGKICVSKSIGLAYIVGSKFTVFALFYFVFEGTSPPGGGAYIWSSFLPCFGWPWIAQKLFHFLFFFCRHHCMLMQLLFSLALQGKSCFGSPRGIKKQRKRSFYVIVYAVYFSFV